MLSTLSHPYERTILLINFQRITADNGVPNQSPTQLPKFRNQVCQKNLDSLWEYYFLDRLDRMKNPSPFLS